jgi:hypothetical protein
MALDHTSLGYEQLDYVFDAIFAANIILTFFTGYIDDTTGFLVGDLKQIGVRYIKYFHHTPQLINVELRSY